MLQGRHGRLVHRHRVWPDHPEGRAILDDIRRDGFHVLRGFYERSTCSRLIGLIDAIVTEHADRLEIDEEESDHRIWGSEKASAQIRSFYDDPILRSFAESYLGTRAANITTLGAKLLARPDNKGSGGGWHRDSMFEKQFKAIIYLNDVCGARRPLPVPGRVEYSAKCPQHPGVLPRPGQPETVRRIRTSIACAARTPDASRRHPPASAGDVILVDTRGIHQGRPIEAGVRYALTNYYTSAHRYHVHSPGFAELIQVLMHVASR